MQNAKNVETPLDSSLDRRQILTGAGIAAGAMFWMQAAAAQERSANESANVEVVNAFCAAWSSLDLSQVTALMSDDAVYRMTETTPPITGHQALIDQMQPWIETSDAITFRILETFARGPLVVNHRIDTFSSTTRPLTWEGVGVFLVQDGRIQEWFDYTIRVDRG
jgi:limonene-1,2-epoxide hydrolase